MATRFSKWWLVVGVSLFYFLATFRLMTVTHDCPPTDKGDSNFGKQPEMSHEGSYNVRHVVKERQEQQEEIHGPQGNAVVREDQGAARPIDGPKPLEVPKGKMPSSPRPKLHFEIENRGHLEILDPNLAPNNVIYVWCGKRWFEFHNYLSVKSAIRELRPDNLIFYYDIYPVMDYWLYNTWFDELRREFPFFRIREVQADENACSDFMKPNMTFVKNRLSLRGGIYINEFTILSDFPLDLRSYSLVNGLEDGYKGFLLSKRNMLYKNDIQAVMDDNTQKTTSIKCLSVSEFNKAETTPTCTTVDGTFFPKDIWELKSKFGRLCRKIFYNNPEITLPQKNYDELIPNIAHVVWIGGGEMDYLFYLCMLSLLYVADVEMVYLHGDAPPSGPLWEKIKGNPRIRQIYREHPQTVYGTNVNVLSHVTDIWRVDFMVKYGGIYVDTDTIWGKPLDREIRAYDAVGSYDWTYWNHPFPDSINYGVAIGKRNATYWRMFQESMNWFIDKDWSWNGLRQPYRIKERHPELVLINPHLQVICYEFKCRPTWYPNYHNESIHHLNSPSLLNWREDAYAYHFTLPTPPELRSEEALLSTDSIIAEMGRNVLEKAGLLKPQTKGPPTKHV